MMEQREGIGTPVEQEQTNQDRHQRHADAAGRNEDFSRPVIAVCPCNRFLKPVHKSHSPFDKKRGSRENLFPSDFP